MRDDIIQRTIALGKQQLSEKKKLAEVQKPKDSELE